MGELDKKTTLKEIDAGDRSILVHRENDLYFMIVTNTIPTTLLRSSIRYFAKLFFETKSFEISNYSKSGRVIQEMDDMIFQAFPYTTGLIIQPWE